MDRERVLKEVERIVRGIPGTVDMGFLDPELKRQVAEIEHQTEENGAVGGLMPFVNKGVWETLNREVCFVMVIGPKWIDEITPEHAIYLLDGKGQVVGEFLKEERRSEMRKRDDVCFLSEDFVLYSGLDIEGEPYFLVPEIEFRALDNIKGVTKVASASISPPADHLLRKTLGYAQTKHWTHLVGFDLSEEDDG